MCREQATEFRSRKAEFDAAGVRLAFVGSGGPHFARAFVEAYDLAGIPVLSDEKLEAYRLFEFKRSAKALMP